MKQLIIQVYFLLLIFNLKLHVLSQRVAINFNGSPADNSAILDINSNTINPPKGIILPSLSNTQRNNLNPANGLLIFNNSTNRLNYWNGSAWLELIANTTTSTNPGGTGISGGIMIDLASNPPHHSALLHIVTTSGGILIPRMTTAQRNAIISPANGLLIYDISVNRFSYYNASTSSWEYLCGISVSTTTGTTVVNRGVAINETGTSAAASAILDVNSNNKGLLIPRLSTAERNSIPSPAVGLTIYNTTLNCFETFIGSNTWIQINKSSMSAPNALSATSINADSFTANWNTVSGATCYIIDVATDASFTSILPSYNNLNVGNVTSYNITGLNCETTYYYRVRACNPCDNSPNSNIISVNTNECLVICNSQAFQKYNLNVGVMINDPAEQNNNSQIEKYCYNNVAANCATFGGLYQWAEALNTSYANNTANFTGPWATCNPCGTGGIQGICPTGFHIPTDYEFSSFEHCVETTIAPVGSTSLFTFQNGFGLRGSDIPQGPGHKMKVTNTHTPAWDGSNASGFSALPSGMRQAGGGFIYAFSFDVRAFYWTALEQDFLNAWPRKIYSSTGQIDRIYDDKKRGYSVRCIKN